MIDEGQRKMRGFSHTFCIPLFKAMLASASSEDITTVHMDTTLTRHRRRERVMDPHLDLIDNDVYGKNWRYRVVEVRKVVKVRRALRRLWWWGTRVVK
jgi:hypothetical protein